MYEDIFAQIRNEAERRNLKENTINAYCNSVGYFLRTVNKDVSALTTDDVDAFLTEKRLGGLAPRTYNHYHSSILFFYTHILRSGICQSKDPNQDHITNGSCNNRQVHIAP